ncbi:MAG TPA: membrane protein insertion efficiency factor YidD [Candidatus Atribacteria bacterium]|nr:membrane protein insertion efficiency factor YidD [Candidatus Atribacteria bacterium]HPZ81424.1 membrane protein insertion efficiency factor YidD [Candidatus Atribacteria bacterium]HQE25036.1 membrane protein insertion efficiency factor YidD [Candidatus Atribacteria bacterium]
MKLSSFIVSGVDKVLLFYQKYISPLFPPCCRFEPSCSEYARQALRKYGLWKGGLLALRRLLRCHPYSPGGYDPVK